MHGFRNMKDMFAAVRDEEAIQEQETLSENE